METLNSIANLLVLLSIATVNFLKAYELMLKLGVGA